MENDKLIKQIDNFRFQISLLQREDRYVVKYESKTHGIPSESEVVKDFKIANFLFEVKLNELEGQ